ncbi:hypothetical protein V406_02722, partial [Staphylococcus aureus W83137]
QPTSDDYVKLDKNNFPDYEYSRHDQQIYVNGKQYKVIFNGVINPKQKDNKVSFELKFENYRITIRRKYWNKPRVRRKQKGWIVVV